MPPADYDLREAGAWQLGWACGHEDGWNDGSRYRLASGLFALTMGFAAGLVIGIVIGLLS